MASRGKIARFDARFPERESLQYSHTRRIQPAAVLDRARPVLAFHRSLAAAVARRIIRVTWSFALTAVSFILGWPVAYTRKISLANAWPIDSTAEKSRKTSLNRSNRARIRRDWARDTKRS